MDINKGKIFKKGSKQSGITLVALVVTIVVLLILAGISIRLVLDNNGIITRAGEGKEKYGQAKENEQNDLDNALEWMDEMDKPPIVEPENIDDWEYKTEDDGTLTIIGYEGTETEVVIPNSINGKRVKKVTGQSLKWQGVANDYQVPIWSSSIRNGEYYYIGCAHLETQDTITSVIISYGIQELGVGAFSASTALTDITIPESVTSIEPDVFRGCTSLISITIPDSVTRIGDEAFRDCTSLTNIVIPDSVANIGYYAFDGCTSLTSITIPDSVTNIGFFTFGGCTSLTSIIIPESVTSIEELTFSGCTSLTTVNYTGTEEQWKNITIGTNNDPLTSATIVYNYNKNV